MALGENFLIDSKLKKVSSGGHPLEGRGAETDSPQGGGEHGGGEGGLVWEKKEPFSPNNKVDALRL